MPMQTPEHSIVLTRQMQASSREIYAAWTDPKKMARWLGKVTADVRVGGRYRFESPAEAGKTHVYTGEYLVLEEDRRVLLSFLAGEPNTAEPNPYPSEFIEIRISALALTQAEVTFVNGWNGDAISEEFRHVATAAWSEWLDRMEKALSTN